MDPSRDNPNYLDTWHVFLPSDVSLVGLYARMMVLEYFNSRTGRHMLRLQNPGSIQATCSVRVQRGVLLRTLVRTSWCFVAALAPLVTAAWEIKLKPQVV